MSETPQESETKTDDLGDTGFPPYVQFEPILCLMMIDSQISERVDPYRWYDPR